MCRNFYMIPKFCSLLFVLNHNIHQARTGDYTSFLKSSVLSCLLDAGLLFLLRFSLDDSVEAVMSAAVHALHALLVSSDDEVSGHLMGRFSCLNVFYKCVNVDFGF